MAAEIATASFSGCRSASGFNEAAANGRGNRTSGRRWGGTGGSFNEAAANGRGNPRRRLAEAEAARDASMRPRRMAAEIDGRGPHRPRNNLCFNEAAANGRGNPPLVEDR